jgi:pilus assembly protein CpaE
MGVATLIAPASSEPSGEHKIITILSPKGGAGKTSVSANLAVGLGRLHPRRVALVDLDLQFGDVANVLGLSPTTTIGDIAVKWPVDSANLKLALTSHPSGIYTLCAPLNPAQADEVTAEHVNGVLRMLQQSFDYVIVDTDPGLSERVLSALDVSTDIVLVCATEIPSIRGLQKALTALDVVGLTGARRHFLLNRADAKVGVELEDIERTIGQHVDIQVPSSIDMVRATNDCVPVMESRTSPHLVKAFDQLVDRMEPASEPGDVVGPASRRLFKRKA